MPQHARACDELLLGPCRSGERRPRRQRNRGRPWWARERAGRPASQPARRLSRLIYCSVTTDAAAAAAAASADWRPRGSDSGRPAGRALPCAAHSMGPVARAQWHVCAQLRLARSLTCAPQCDTSSAFQSALLRLGRRRPRRRPSPRPVSRRPPDGRGPRTNERASERTNERTNNARVAPRRFVCRPAGSLARKLAASRKSARSQPGGET